MRARWARGRAEAVAERSQPIFYFALPKCGHKKEPQASYAPGVYTELLPHSLGFSDRTAGVSGDGCRPVGLLRGR